MSVTIQQAAKNLLERWDEFGANDESYDKAYYLLVKYARKDWEALRAAVHDHSDGNQEGIGK